MLTEYRAVVVGHVTLQFANIVIHISLTSIFTQLISIQINNSRENVAPILCKIRLASQLIDLTCITPPERLRSGYKCSVTLNLVIVSSLLYSLFLFWRASKLSLSVFHHILILCESIPSVLVPAFLVKYKTVFLSPRGAGFDSSQNESLVINGNVVTVCRINYFSYLF